MKKAVLPLLCILFPIAVTLIASVFGNIFVTLGALVLSLAILAFIFRADILMLIGSRKYMNNHAEGLKWMERASKTGTLRPRSRLLYAYLLLRNGFLDEAEGIINKTTYLGKHALKESDLKKADFNLALIHWKRGNLNDAIMEMEELYADGFLNSMLYGSLGYFYIANNETDKAIELSKEGMEYNSDDMITMDNLGQAYIISGMLDEAHKLYEELFEKNPEFIEPYYNYGTLLEKRGELAEAKEYYQKALEYDEKYLSTVTHSAINEAIAHINELLM